MFCEMKKSYAAEFMLSVSFTAADWVWSTLSVYSSRLGLTPSVDVLQLVGCDAKIHCTTAGWVRHAGLVYRGWLGVRLSISVLWLWCEAQCTESIVGCNMTVWLRVPHPNCLWFVDKWYMIFLFNFLFFFFSQPAWKIADPICTFVFSVFVLATTITILRDILRVLMEG